MPSSTSATRKDIGLFDWIKEQWNSLTTTSNEKTSNQLPQNRDEYISPQESCSPKNLHIFNSGNSICLD